jgi:hypothetical protein
MSSPVPSDTPSVTPTTSKSAVPATDEALTVKNSKDLRKLLAVGDDCSETVSRFASKYQGRTITFDGSVSAVSNHSNYNTRFDFLLAPWNRGSESGSGPTFQFQNVNYYDLNLTGKNVPDSVGLDDKLRITAEVGDFDPDSCLYFLDPVSTEAR